MFPHLVMRAYAAKDEKTIMRSTAWMSWYSILAFPIVIVGLYAILMYPELANPDWAVMWTVRDMFPAWAVGLVGAGGAAAAISTGAGLIQASAGIIARNVVQKGFWPKASDIQTAWIARFLVFIVTIVALLLQLYAPSLLVSLLLMSYSGMVQFFPGIVLGLKTKWVTKAGVASGLISGVFVVILTTYVWSNPLQIHSGIWGLLVNLIVTIIVSKITTPPSETTIKAFLEEAATKA